MNETQQQWPEDVADWPETASTVQGGVALISYKSQGKTWDEATQQANPTKPLTGERNELIDSISQARIRLASLGVVGDYMGKKAVLHESVLEMFDRSLGKHLSTDAEIIPREELDLVLLTEEAAQNQTELDRIAEMAMQGLLANSGGPIQANGMSGWGLCNITVEQVAEFAYDISGAMLAEKKKRQQKQNAAFGSNPLDAGWISVEERLPEEGQHCLVRIKFVNEDGTVSVEVDFDRMVNGVWELWSMDGLTDPNITHWQPINHGQKGGTA